VGTLQGTFRLSTRLYDVEIIGFTPQFLGQGPHMRVLDGLPRVRAVRKAHTILEARMAYRMIV
jgi:hypothetical protein